MSNKLLGIILLVTLGSAFLLGYFEEFVGYELVDALTVLLGLSLIIFGTWSGIRLIK